MKRNKSSLSGAGIALIIAVVFILTRRSAPSIFGIISKLLGLGILLAALLVALVILAVVKSNKDQSKKQTSAVNTGSTRLTADQSTSITNGRNSLMELRRLAVKIRSNEIRSKANSVCTVIDKILLVLREKPEQISNVRQCLNYYLPTIYEVLTKYLRLEEKGVLASDMAQKVSTFLTDVQKALDKQYEHLFEDDKLDMTVDMEAMTMACKRDGLLEDEASKVQGQESPITLTL